jgi:methylglyoxal synthase
MKQPATAPRRPTVALVAHDCMKDHMVALAREFLPLLRASQLIVTGTSGRRLRDELALDVECLLSGPMGGDLQICRSARGCRSGR